MGLLDRAAEIKQIRVLQDQRPVDALRGKVFLKPPDAAIKFFARGALCHWLHRVPPEVSCHMDSRSAFFRFNLKRPPVVANPERFHRFFRPPQECLALMIKGNRIVTIKP